MTQSLPIVARILAVLAVVASLLSLYVKLYFWGGTEFAPVATTVALWALIFAGPIAAYLSVRRPKSALMLIGIQTGILLWLAL